MSWRRRLESNQRVKVLQTFALPLGYAALNWRSRIDATVLKSSTVTARVSKRPTDESAVCLRARYCIDLAWLDLDQCVDRVTSEAGGA